jgi:hypothetical protein
MQAWEAGIDRKLVARLAHPLVQPGVIRMGLVRRILAGVAALTERLPLLARFGRTRELVATTRIVHAQWTRPAPEAVATTPPIARPIVHAVPSRTVERSSNPVVTREPPATTILVAAQEPRPAAPVGEVPAAREHRPAAPRSSHDLVRIADPTVRRSRVGAPLPARPQLAARVERHDPPAPLIVAPTARATAGPRAATASPLLRVRPRATDPVPPARIADAPAPASPAVVAVTRAAPPPAPATRPIVAPRTGELPLAHPLPIAHPPPAAPAAVAVLPAASAPGTIAAPLPVARAAEPSAPPPQKIDLHRLAEQVQQILVRQAAHTRARQGLPR